MPPSLRDGGHDRQLLNPETLCFGMSSYVETLGWQSNFDLATYDWQGWIDAAADMVPLPVYDLRKIIDTSAIWDIFYHGRHWPADRAHELNGVHIPAAMTAAIEHAGVNLPHQVQYIARALYNHCARYTSGVPFVRAVPVDHMLCLRVVPAAVFQSLVAAIKADRATARRLACWLQNVIVWRSSRPATIPSFIVPEVKHRHGRRIGRDDSTVDTETAQAAINRVLSKITDHHETLPKLSCTVTAVRIGASKVLIGLYARQPALFDE